jgi:hypothetical protein
MTTDSPAGARRTYSLSLFLSALSPTERVFDAEYAKLDPPRKGYQDY